MMTLASPTTRETFNGTHSDDRTRWGAVMAIDQPLPPFGDTSWYDWAAAIHAIVDNVASDPDLAALAAANNSDVLAGITEAPASGAQTLLDIESLRNELAQATQSTAPRSQFVAVASGPTQIDLQKGWTVFVRTTSGAWSPEFINLPSGSTHVIVVADITTNDDDMTLPTGFAWEGTAPSTFDADYRYIFEFLVLEDGTGTAQWLGDPIVIDDPAVVAPTLALFYSSSQSRTSPAALDAATGITGNTVVFATTTDDAVVSKLRFFLNINPAAMPALGAESASDRWVGNRSVAPYSLLGSVAGVPTSSTFWDTTTDPTGNALISFDENGVNTITIDAELIDGTLTDPVTASFTLANTAPTADPTWTFTQTGYTSATSQPTITIPSGVDRAVVVHAFYSGQQELTSATLNGVAMTKSQALYNLTSQEWGRAIFTLTEASLSTGNLTLVPTFTGTRVIPDTIVYSVWVFTNLATPSFIHIGSYTNSGTTHTEVNALGTVPANSFIMSSCANQGNSSATPMTSNLGGDDISPVLFTDNSWRDVTSRAETETDSGAEASKTITWSTVVGRGGALSTALSYATSGGGPPDPPVTPGTPTISSVVAADNQLTVTWGATTDAVSYQISWDSVNPPTRTPVAVSGLIRVITGLAASVLQYVRVRAVSSTNTVGPWSTVSSGTPTGGIVDPPYPSNGRLVTTTDAYQCSMVEGNQPPDWGDVYIPNAYRRINIPGEINAVADSVKAGWDWGDRFIAKWFNAGKRTSYATATGPRLIITGQTVMNSTWSPHLRWSENPQLTIDAVLGFMKSGSTGAINHNWAWQRIGSDLNRTVVVNGTSFNLWEHILYSISHEPNSWAAGYWGTNTNCIGRPEFGPGNITLANYGAAVRDAAAVVYNTGNLAPLHKAVVNNIAAQIRSTCPEAILGMSPAESGSSYPVGTPPGNLSDAWPYDAFPDKGSIDFITPTDYPFRGSGALTFTGGDITNPANWTKPGGWLTNSLNYANEWGCAYGLLEYSGSYAYPGNTQGLSPGVGTYSDADVRMIHRRMFEIELPSAANGLVFVNHWLFPTWDQSKADPGRSWVVLEGCYGAAPPGVTFTSTAKPAWSTVTTSDGAGNLWYQKSLNWFRETFPA